MGTVYLTAEGKKQLEEKLEMYKTELRPACAKKIGIAREFGDLSENAEYDAAKEEQARIEAEISEMEAKLRNCAIISKKDLDTKSVSLGSTVTLFDNEFEEEVTYKILGSTESNPTAGLISNESPVGRALLGKKVGSIVEVNTPNGVLSFKILKISI